MSDQFGTVTDRLADVMRVITFSRQTGTLSAERSGQQGQETIYIRYLRGKVIDTQVHPYYQGSDPVGWLQSWGSCRYKFEHTTNEKVKTETPQAPANPPQTQPTPPTRTITPIPRTAITPTPRIAGNTDPLHPITWPGYPPQSDYLRLTQVSPQQTDPYQTPLPQMPMQKVPMQRVPKRRFINDENSMRLLRQQGLSRSHRQIFLLIDNQRSAQEIARLTSKRLDEIYTILLDLENIGLISL
ncbi:hypothetical protein KDA_22400 [Dictyobacter alpinus]|uniref:DUF4388 domain-containing protein n=1 Tax=Dictyobacter alpinus TaxID=2014873 RepID=A0A402B5X8_9CHLR|nr:DUF4388 domain-containing protein [Dictyobacter alpinus]GCE26756.1 hypothetical protein KDA_22400 [Dictyobacter alpinus]